MNPDSIAWLFNSSANQTLAYVNATGRLVPDEQQADGGRPGEQYPSGSRQSDRVRGLSALRERRNGGQRGGGGNLEQYRLMTIPGIGPVVASTVLASVGDISRFRMPEAELLRQD